MDTRKFKDLDLYFHESRLEMTQAGRLLVRLIFYSSYVILITATLTFLLSDIPALFWIGILALLFLLDRLKYYGQAERSIRKIAVRSGKRVNLSWYLMPASFLVVEYAFERALWTNGNFYLFLIKRLVQKKQIQEGLRRMDINPEEMENKIDEYLESSLAEKKDLGNRAEQKKLLFTEAEKLIKLAFN